MTESGRPREEYRKQPYIEVTETLRLSENRNFYDQFPFRDVFAQTSATYFRPEFGKQTDDMVLGISTVVSKFLQRSEKEHARQGAAFDKDAFLQTYVEYPRGIREELMTGLMKVKYSMSKEFDVACATSLADVSTQLSMYPEWQTYITSNIGFNAMYTPGGELAAKTRQMKQIVYPKTYLAWSTERQATQQRIASGMIMQVVGEAFPQDVQGQSAVHAVPNVGDRRASLTWRLDGFSKIKRNRQSR